MATSEGQLIADMTDLVVDRLEAWRAGDSQRVAAIDARAPKDPIALAALYAAAFGIAERTLNVLTARDPAEAQRTLDSFRDQVQELRRL